MGTVTVNVYDKDNKSLGTAKFRLHDGHLMLSSIATKLSVQELCFSEDEAAVDVDKDGFTLQQFQPDTTVSFIGTRAEEAANTSGRGGGGAGGQPGLKASHGPTVAAGTRSSVGIASGGSSVAPVTKNDLEGLGAVLKEQVIEQLNNFKPKIDLIERLVKESSEATRHASTISIQDLDILLAALRICFAPVDDELLEADAEASFLDPTEFQWAENKHEARHRNEYLNTMTEKLNLKARLRWSKPTPMSPMSPMSDTDVLKTSLMCAGGASLPFKLGCRTDAMVTVARSRLAEEASIVATVELKKKVVAQSLRQTKVTFVCATLKSLLPVISCVTDMRNAAVAYYTTGQRRSGDGATVCIEQFFPNVDKMLEWLSKALDAVPSDVLRFRGENVYLPNELLFPKRVRLSAPPLALGNVAGPNIVANALGENDDIARLADLDNM